MRAISQYEIPYRFLQSWRNKPRLDLILVFFLGLLNSYVLSPSLKTSLSLTSTEDGPVQPSLAFKFPINFKNDVFAYDSQYLMWSTITKWFPAMLYKYLDLNPQIFHIAFVYSQTILMLLSVYLFGKVFFNSRKVGLIAVVLTVIISPYFNNLGSYGGQFFMPYSTWISVGPLVFCAAFYVGKKYNISLYFFTIGVAIHPSMAISFLPLLGTLILTDNYLEFKNKIGLFVKFSAPLILYSVFLLWIHKHASASEVPKSWISDQKTTFHWSAWKLNPDLSTFQTTSYTLIVAIFMYLSLKYFDFFEPHVIKVTNLFLSLTVLFVGIQASAYTFDIDSIYRLSLARVTIFSSIFLVIIASKIITELLEPENIRYARQAQVLAVCYLLQTFGVMLFLIFYYSGVMAWRVINLKQSRWRVIEYAMLSFLAFFLYQAVNAKAWTLVGSFDQNIKNLVLIPNGIFLRAVIDVIGSTLVLSAILFLLAILTLIKVKFEVFSRVIYAGLIVIVIGTLVVRITQSNIRSSNHVEWADVQLWAKDYSTLDSKFILDGKIDLYMSWTTLSERSRISSAGGSSTIYLYSKLSQEIDRKMSLIGRAPAFQDKPDIIESYYFLFGEEFDAKYLIRKTIWTKLNWEVAYSNEMYVVYEIPTVNLN